jgi:hypothetical protein
MKVKRIHVAEAAGKELVPRRQLQALMAAAGAWKDEDHPELAQGSVQWVRTLRRESGAKKPAKAEVKQT